MGGINAVTLSDEEARRRGTQKTVLERKAPPTFDVLIEIQNKDLLAIHRDVADAVDQMLRGYIPPTEIRERKEAGEVTIRELAPAQRKAVQSPVGRQPVSARSDARGAGVDDGKRKVLRIFPYAVSRERL